jgi:hypothetical protein
LCLPLHLEGVQGGFEVGEAVKAVEAEEVNDLGVEEMRCPVLAH